MFDFSIVLQLEACLEEEIEQHDCDDGDGGSNGGSRFSLCGHVFNKTLTIFVGAEVVTAVVARLCWWACKVMNSVT